MTRTTGFLSSFACWLMVLNYRLVGLFVKPGTVLYELGIRKGGNVVDFGCGPGRYVRTAAAPEGEGGRVYAVDLQPMAVRVVAKMSAKYRLHNVQPVLARRGKTEIEDGCEDLVYALDMFHEVTEPEPFLAEIWRITKQTRIALSSSPR